MRDRNFRTLTIAELEWLVLPPIMVGQFALAHAPMDRSAAKGEKSKAQQNGAALVPVAVALWARVSPGIDKALSESLDKAIKLQAADWSSGDRLWLLALAGDQRAVPQVSRSVGEEGFPGSPGQNAQTDAGGQSRDPDDRSASLNCRFSHVRSAGWLRRGATVNSPIAFFEVERQITSTINELIMVGEAVQVLIPAEPDHCADNQLREFKKRRPLRQLLGSGFFRATGTAVVSPVYFAGLQKR